MPQSLKAWRRASILGMLLDADSGDSEVRRQEGIEVTQANGGGSHGVDETGAHAFGVIGVLMGRC